MTVGTKSLLFGAHAFYLHPFAIAWAWTKLFGVPFDPRLWLCFVAHDLGYLSMPLVEGPDSERHVELGARIVTWLCGSEFGDECYWHSRQYAKARGLRVSRLGIADKLAFALMPAWLYLPMVRASGELREYMTKSIERQAGGDGFMPEEREAMLSGDARRWLEALQAYTRRWVQAQMAASSKAMASAPAR